MRVSCWGFAGNSRCRSSSAPTPGCGLVAGTIRHREGGRADEGDGLGHHPDPDPDLSPGDPDHREPDRRPFGPGHRRSKSESPRRRWGDADDWAPDHQRPLDLSLEALQTARQLGDKAALAYALDSRHVAIWGPDDLEERRSVADEMHRLGLELGDRDLQLAALAWLITDALECQSIEVVDRYTDEHARLADELHQPYYPWYTAVVQSTRAFMRGRFAETEQLAIDAWRYGELSHGENARQVYLFTVLNLRRESGELEDFLRGLEGFVEESPLPAWRSALAMAYAELDREREALAQVSCFVAGSSGAVPRDSVWFATMAMLAMTIVRFDAGEYAKPIYDLLVPFAERNAVVGGAVFNLGPVSQFLGMLARVNGDLNRSIDHLADALERCSAQGAPPQEARTRCEMARTLIARDAGRDAKRAAVLLEEAKRTARELGMVRLSPK